MLCMLCLEIPVHENLVVYKSMQENCDYSEKTLDLIKSLKIFALCDGSLVSLNERIVFFPVENVKGPKKCKFCRG